MPLFEIILALLLGAIILSALARQLNVPYPTLLAIGGALVAFLPHAPRLDLPADLILALFVAPVLLDAAYDTSLRDLRRNWRPVLSLVLVAVILTTATVAVAVRLLIPDFPIAAAVALGALLAPPDAVAALAVLRQVNPPHRIRMVLEGESLLNDASALILYKLAVATVAAGSFDAVGAIPTFALVIVGSVALGWLLTLPIAYATARIEDAPTSVILQFVATFGIWLLAEHFGLSAVIAIVVFGLTLAQSRNRVMPARLRVPSFAVWESATFVLNVLAFTLIGLQIRPIFEQTAGWARWHLLLAALAILAVVIFVRLAWVMTYTLFQGRRRPSASSVPPLRAGAGLVIGWSGMRGIVTLAAAMALPHDFPQRDFIQLTAFVVVLGTLVIQGLTLRPLLYFLRLPKDDTVENEISIARKAALKAAISELEGDDSPSGERLRLEYEEILRHVKSGKDPHATLNHTLRLRVVTKSRRAISDLRDRGAIGDDAYRFVEEELDWLDLTARPPSA